MRLRCSSECSTSGVATYRLPRPLRFYVPWGFPVAGVPAQANARTDPLASLCSSSAHPAPGRTCQPCTPRGRATLMGFSPLQRSGNGNPLTWACLTQYGPHSGFLTLSAAYASRAPRPCFMPKRSWGFTLQRNDRCASRRRLSTPPASPAVDRTRQAGPPRLRRLEHTQQLGDRRSERPNLSWACGPLKLSPDQPRPRKGPTLMALVPGDLTFRALATGRLACPSSELEEGCRLLWAFLTSSRPHLFGGSAALDYSSEPPQLKKRKIRLRAARQPTEAFGMNPCR